jgi:predicted nucleic acid-binding protein
MRCFFDTHILVYLHDPRDSRKQECARELLTQHLLAGSFVISTQVLQEFCATVLRQRLLPPEIALDTAQQLASEDVRPTTADTVLLGVALAQRHQLSIWDGLIVQAALDAGCTTLFTEDLQDGQRFGALQVVNPFLPSAHEVPPPAYKGARRSATPEA